MPTRKSARRLSSTTVSGALLLVITGCQAPAAPPPTPDEPQAPKTQEVPTAAAPDRTEPSAPEEVRIPAGLDDADRWLFVEKAQDGVEGAWATGSFNRERNRLTIRERDVQQFAVDTSRIPINWERLVVISINGQSSELKKRDYPFLHFTRDEHGGWVVLEP